MSPRRFLPVLAAAVMLSTVSAFAQDPAPAPADAPKPRVRSPREARARDGGSEGAVRRRETAAAAGEAAPRARVVLADATPAPAPAPAASADDQQGGRRNPRAGGSGGGRGNGGAVGRRGGDGRGSSADGGQPSRPSGSADGRRDGYRGQAVPRVYAPRPRGTYVVPNYGRRYYNRGGLGYYYYDPFSWYGYGAYGYGWPGYYGSYGGYYGNYGGYYGGAYGGAYGYGRYAGPYGWDIGGLKLKVRPRDAEVYVDGYYAGIVDDFDGAFQQLRLDAGGYHIEIRKPGMQPLGFDIHIQPGRTITYRGDLYGAP